MKPTVYLDATIPSFYYDERPGAIVRAWREITIQFWRNAKNHYELYVSDETIRELEDLGYPAVKRERCLRLVANLPRLVLTDEVTDLAALYVQEGVMPSNDFGDAFHLAFATWYRISYLVTWNCKHLANANKFGRIQAANAQRRLASPLLVTPEQLLEVSP